MGCKATRIRLGRKLKKMSKQMHDAMTLEELTEILGESKVNQLFLEWLAKANTASIPEELANLDIFNISE